MADPASSARPRVALVFGDGASARHLREAVAGQVELVYDTPAAEFDPARLLESGATAVLVNLDSCEWVDAIDASATAAGIPAVFNDPEVSRNLEGWDRARWLRHMTAKLCGNVEYDPPRPADVSLPIASLAASCDAGLSGEIPVGHPTAAVQPRACEEQSGFAAVPEPESKNASFDVDEPTPDDQTDDHDTLDVDTEALSALIDARLAEPSDPSASNVEGVLFVEAGAVTAPFAAAAESSFAEAAVPANDAAQVTEVHALPAGGRLEDADDPFVELPALAEWQLVDPDAPLASQPVSVDGPARSSAPVLEDFASLELVPMETLVPVELHSEPIERWMHVEERKRATVDGDRKPAVSRRPDPDGGSA